MKNPNNHISCLLERILSLSTGANVEDNCYLIIYKSHNKDYLVLSDKHRHQKHWYWYLDINLMSRRIPNIISCLSGNSRRHTENRSYLWLETKVFLKALVKTLEEWRVLCWSLEEVRTEIQYWSIYYCPFATVYILCLQF